MCQNITLIVNCHGCEMVNVLALSVVNNRFDPESGQSKDYETGICCFSALVNSIKELRAKTGWLRIRIMCPSRVKCLSVDLFL